jgi:hypothetical protein
MDVERESSPIIEDDVWPRYSTSSRQRGMDSFVQ